MAIHYALFLSLGPRETPNASFGSRSEKVWKPCIKALTHQPDYLASSVTKVCSMCAVRSAVVKAVGDLFKPVWVIFHRLKMLNPS